MEAADANSSYARIPVWDGRPENWLSFKRDVDWWLEGEDLNKITYNLAVRLAQKQSLTVKRIAREHDPESLRAVPNVCYTQVEVETYNASNRP